MLSESGFFLGMWLAKEFSFPSFEAHSLHCPKKPALPGLDVGPLPILIVIGSSSVNLMTWLHWHWLVMRSRQRCQACQFEIMLIGTNNILEGCCIVESWKTSWIKKHQLGGNLGTTVKVSFWQITGRMLWSQHQGKKGQSYVRIGNLPITNLLLMADAWCLPMRNMQTDCHCWSLQMNICLTIRVMSKLSLMIPISIKADKITVHRL